MNHKNYIRTSYFLSIFTCLIVLFGCYYCRTIEFVLAEEQYNFENWHIDVYMKAYTGPRDADHIDASKFFFSACASTIQYFQGGGKYKPTAYETVIENIEIFFGDDKENKALDYEWKKDGRSNQESCWTPIDHYLYVPPNINELTIVANVNFFSNNSSPLLREFVVKMRRSDEENLMFDGI